MRITRNQALVLGFVLVAWIGLIAILVAAPDVLAGSLKVDAGDSRSVELAFLLAITALLGLLTVGVVRHWRWMFWLVLVAFLAGALRVPATALELVGVLPMSGPTWYALVQAGIGLVQVLIGLAMLSGLRSSGQVWGP